MTNYIPSRVKLPPRYFISHYHATRSLLLMENCWKRILRKTLKFIFLSSFDIFPRFPFFQKASRGIERISDSTNRAYRQRDNFLNYPVNRVCTILSLCAETRRSRNSGMIGIGRRNASIGRSSRKGP